MIESTTVFTLTNNGASGPIDVARRNEDQILIHQTGMFCGPQNIYLSPDKVEEFIEMIKSV